MAYYLLKTENGEAMILTTSKEYSEQEIVSICEEITNRDVDSLVRCLQKVGICRCFTLVQPRFAYTILLKIDGEIEVTRHPEYSIVMFGENGNLVRVESKIYGTKEEAQERLEKLQKVYVVDLFVATK